MANKQASKGATRRKAGFAFKKNALIVFKVLPVLLLIAAVPVGFYKMPTMDWQLMKVNEYQLLSELVYQSEADVIDVLDSYLDRSILLLDLKEVQNEITTLPWVSDVRVMKQWPNKLAVEVLEYQPVAIWNDQEVLNSEGIPLQKPVTEMVLAHLYGPRDSASSVMLQYLQFTQVFQDLGVQIVEVRMHPRGAWALKLENGIAVSLGEKNVLKRSRRVVRILKSAEYADKKIEQIDARYPGGVAIRLTSENTLEA